MEVQVLVCVDCCFTKAFCLTFFFNFQGVCIISAFSFLAAYVGLATIAGFIWWFVYSESGPKLPYSELVRFCICYNYVNPVNEVS